MPTTDPNPLPNPLPSPLPSALPDPVPRVVSSAPDADPGVDAMLVAYQALQVQNVRVASSVAHRLGLGVNDMRSVMFASWTPDLTPKQLAGFLELSSGAVTALVDRLVDGGFVERRKHPSDRRSSTLSLTAAGAEAADAVVSTYRESFADAVAPEERARASATFVAVAASLERHLAP